MRRTGYLGCFLLLCSCSFTALEQNTHRQCPQGWPEDVFTKIDLSKNEIKEELSRVCQGKK